jgi:hypothetical protein
MEAFDVICHEIAMAEMQVCKAPGLSALGLPTRYLLREVYCTEPGCDCRRVLVYFIADAERLQVAACINYGWETEEFYRKWSGHPELAREMTGATLEPFGEQGPHAERFLRVFNQVVQDPAVVAAFRRHYTLVRKLTDK